MPEEKSEDKKLTKKEEETLHVFFIEKVVTLMTGAMGLVAALAWNDAIRKLFERVFGTQGSGDITAMFVYAAIVTTAVVVVTYRLTRIVERMKKKKEKK
jgi:TRAP-type C4-dicarboxylate transport system permease small subunit